MYWGIPTGWALDALEKCIESIFVHDDVDKMILVINNPDNTSEIEKISSKYDDDNIFLIHPEENIGVAASWNLCADIAFRLSGADRIMLVNDDIEITEQTIDAFGEPSEFIVFRYSEHSFALFELTTEVFDTVGRFDESNFAYFEDNDYYLRINNAMILTQELKTGAKHSVSSTINSHPAMRAWNDRMFPIAREYYVQKWGGLPGKERFTEAWNGKEATHLGNIYEWKYGAAI